MRWILSIAAVCLGLWCVKARFAEAGEDGPIGTVSPTSSSALPGFAVVELFTSEGCSSCPPADKVLSKIDADARANKQAVYALSFHVDYWNHLGWADRFSSADFSKRQQSYAAALHLDQVYTPQMIVNGEAEFVGSNKEKAQAQIHESLTQQPTGALHLTTELDKRTLTIKFDAADFKANPDLVVNVALVERGLKSSVKAGENSGSHLVHDNVVRVFNSLPLPDSGTGDITLKVPAEVSLERSSVIVFLQNKSMKIISAAAEDLVR